MRADVPLFVGMVRRAAAPLPVGVAQWLAGSDYAKRGPLLRDATAQDTLLDIAVPIDSFAGFEALFAWRERPLEPGSPVMIPTRLGLAVRQFFQEGGARCWVVRVGDPLPLLAEGDGDAAQAHDPEDIAAWRRHLDWVDALPPADAAKRVPLLPGLVARARAADPQRPESWHGAGQIFAVEEAAFLCLPDLPDLIAGPSRRLPDHESPAYGAEQFIDCAPELPGSDPLPAPTRMAYVAPRLDLVGYRAWGDALRHMLTMMDGRNSAAHRRDVILAAALPLPDLDDPAMPAQAQLWPLELDIPGHAGLGEGLFSDGLAASGRVMLAYPWLAGDDTALQPEGSAGGEGALLGMLARSTLTRGAHRAAPGRVLAAARECLPALPAHILKRSPADGPYRWLGDLLCLFAVERGQLRLLSDVTTARSDAWREGGTARLMGAVLRQAALVGQELTFAPNGPESWVRVRQQMEALLDRFYLGGAFAGGNRDHAFQVRCDRTTMLQSDIDGGRIIAEVSFRPARALQHIHVSLALQGEAA